jgi:5-formyltetrahydrofolate cyclo-ligase
VTGAVGKDALRRQALARRGRLEPEVLAASARALTEVVLDVPEVAGARCIASYVSIGREPGTRHLLDLLAGRGVLVLVPVLLVDGDLDWAEYDSSDALVPATRGLLEPTGPRLGVGAISRADVVLAPALAVDRSGTRLGRGGGSFDRALARVRPSALVIALLHDGELLPAGRHLPVETHDHPVHAAGEPIGLTRIR